MATKLIDADAFRAKMRAQGKPDAHVFRVSVGDPVAADDGSRKVRFCFSDGSVDRMGDTIDPKGWEINDFLRNPVALWAHDSSAPPIGRASNVLVEDDRLMGDIEFMPAETYAFADTIYRMVVGKYINAVSVGFLPLEYKWAEDEDERGWGIDFTRQQLLEISVVPVPANQNALAEARAKGIDTRPLVTWAERVLDGGGKMILPKSEIERLRKAAKEPAMTKPKAAPRRKDDGMGEEDESEGGAVSGNCGRPVGEECGMKDQSECSIHGFGGVGTGDGDGDKNLRNMIAREVRAALAKAGKRKDAADGDGADADRPDVSADHEKAVRMCAMHIKAMGSALETANEHHEAAMGAIQEALDNLDAAPPKDDGEGPGDDPEAEKAKVLANLRKRFGI